MEQIFLETTLRYMKNKELTDDGQYDFTCLTNSVAFYDVITEVIDEGRVTNIIYLDLCKTFDYVPHDILAPKLEIHGLH
ncbi:rna-directed dna polymerase from mobile element jockey-like [Pitangus sulphuratus]|nr:rna-directed dna polymerase from mobile element jockey-like [Pitangus sulphuratus]